MTNVRKYANVTKRKNGFTIPFMRFGERFAKWRKAKKVSGWLIEKEIGFARSNLSNMEKGRYIPSDDVLRELASIKALGVSYTRLRGWKALDEYSSEELRQALKDAK